MARRIYGKINVMGGMPIGSRLRVVAWDADVDDDDHMGMALVAEDGTYSIEYSGENWDWSPVKPTTSWRPDIYVVVEWMDPVNNTWKVVEKSKVYSNQDTREDREINLNVNIPTTNACMVYGCVTDVEGNPIDGYTVTAWDEDPFATRRAMREGLESLRLEGKPEAAEFLGSAVTNERGEYRIQYAANYWETLPRWSMRGEATAWWRPDIFIKVHRMSESGVLYRSPTSQNVISITGVKIDAKLEK
ncbi:MAG: hypothetical protein ACETVY_03480 [Candidatus Bathyarchaeia archaeon]